jgi:hypothetical protein
LWLALAVSAALATPPAWAWGPDGHHSVGAIADRLLAGSHAAAQVRNLLGGMSLRDAAVWADCAKGVDPGHDYAYGTAGQYAECAVFETAPLEAELSDFVRRNDRNCARRPDEESCHKQYHYTDVALQREHYALGSTGARTDDVVGAIGAAVRVLRGQPAPAPFDIRTPREALLLLVHYVGDVHQPLHVGAVYLGPVGQRVDPDPGHYDPASDTRGANRIVTIDLHTKSPGPNLHRIWDEIPRTDTDIHVDAAWLARARAVRRTAGDALTWPAAWAGSTLAQSRLAFADLRFGPRANNEWTVTLPADYAARMNAIKKRQLTRAGARLAQLLRALWP